MQHKKTSRVALLLTHLSAFFLITLCIGSIPQTANAENFCVASLSQENISQIFPIQYSKFFIAEIPSTIFRTQSTEHRRQDSVVSGQLAGTDAQFGRLYNRQSPDYQITQSSNSPQPSATIALSTKDIAEDVTTSVSKKIEAMNQRLSKFKIKPRAGAYVPFGKDLEVSYLGGVDLVWSLNNAVDMRLGVEYSKPGIKNGNELEIFKVPFMFVEKENNPDLWGFKKMFYTGLGLVYMSAKYNNRQAEGVGGTFLIGRKLGNFAAEVKFDAMRKKPGQQFGGVSLYVNYSF